MRKETKYLLGAAAVAVGAIAYLVYKVAKDISKLDDIDFENLEDNYYSRATKID
jgi:hypothetical protein